MTTGRIAAAYGRLNSIRQVVLVCTTTKYNVIYILPWAHRSPNTKRHLDRLAIHGPVYTAVFMVHAYGHVRGRVYGPWPVYTVVAVFTGSVYGRVVNTAVTAVYTGASTVYTVGSGKCVPCSRQVYTTMSVNTAVYTGRVRHTGRAHGCLELTTRVHGS